MDRALEDSVWQRAGDACEYCRLPQKFSDAPFQIDHVIAASHGRLFIPVEFFQELINGVV